MTGSKEKDIVILVADLSGYTALTEAHGNASAAKIIISVLLNAPKSLLTDQVGSPPTKRIEPSPRLSREECSAESGSAAQHRKDDIDFPFTCQPRCIGARYLSFAPTSGGKCAHYLTIAVDHILESKKGKLAAAARVFGVHHNNLHTSATRLKIRKKRMLSVI